MRLLRQLLVTAAFFLSQVYSQGLLSRLNELGLNGFSEMLAVYNPALVEAISRRNDVTVWAPGNALVAARLAAVTKRADKPTTHGADVSAQVDHTRPPQTEGKPGKRQAGEGPPGYPDTNFQTIITFLDHPEWVNLGPGEAARFVKNYAAPSAGGIDSTSHIEVVSGLGNTQSSIRGPFKFTNGVIYEVNDFMTLPQPFSATFQQLGIAKNFYKKVVFSGKLPLFEETPAVTIFAPVDQPGNMTVNGHGTENDDPEAHILTGPKALYYSQNLLPGETIVARSGASIKITWAENGERLVNCRRLLKANVVTKNGVVHFIDGPLHGGCSGDSPSSTRPPTPPCTSGVLIDIDI